MLLAMTLALQSLTLIPSDDIWVYPHASDPSTDGYLRVWGVEGEGVPASSSDAESYGLSYLRWSLAGVPTGGKLAEAKLILVQTASPGYTVEQAKAAPLEARALAPSFREKEWQYENVETLLPKRGAESVYGTGYPESTAGETVTISIDLLKGKGDFAKALTAASAAPEREIAIALTSTLDMAAIGRAGIYKLFSKDDRDEKVRPKLVLRFEN